MLRQVASAVVRGAGSRTTVAEEIGGVARKGALAEAARCFSAAGEGEEQEMHDDFKPKMKKSAESLENEGYERVKRMVDADINDHRIMVYMKGTPESPMCGFSNIVCRVLDAYGHRYGSRNVLEDPQLREGIKKYSDWPTIPQVYVNAEFVGGSDLLYQMHQQGELHQVLGSPEQASQ